MRASSAIRATAWTVVAVGVAAPLARRRLRLRPPAVLAAAAAAPVAYCVAVRRSKQRDVVAVALQMWAYLAAYEMPHDDPEALEARVRIDYPVRIDRALGLGMLPSVRLQRAFSDPARIGRFEQLLVWCHWIWFFIPHSTVAYLLLRHHERFPRGAAHMYAVFDLGVVFYWVIPTAPPWYAALQGRMEDSRDPALRRMMVEHGEAFWRDRWDPLYSFLGGNPLAAMPSLHFATSLMAAHLLSEVGPAEAAVGWTYAGLLGLALVYLGEHYVVDILAGAALTEGIRRAAPRAAPLLARVSRTVQALEARAHA